MTCPACGGLLSPGMNVDRFVLKVPRPFLGGTEYLRGSCPDCQTWLVASKAPRRGQDGPEAQSAPTHTPEAPRARRGPYKRR